MSIFWNFQSFFFPPFLRFLSLWFVLLCYIPSTVCFPDRT